MPTRCAMRATELLVRTQPQFNACATAHQNSSFGTWTKPTNRVCESSRSAVAKVRPVVVLDGTMIITDQRKKVL